jgi:Autoinducer binding domain
MPLARTSLIRCRPRSACMRARASTLSASRSRMAETCRNALPGSCPHAWPLAKVTKRGFGGTSKFGDMPEVVECIAFFRIPSISCRQRKIFRIFPKLWRTQRPLWSCPVSPISPSSQKRQAPSTLHISLAVDCALSTQQLSIIDPVIGEALRTPEPFRWGIDFQTKFTSIAQQQLFEEAAQFGIRFGFTVPVHDGHGPVAALTFAVDETIYELCVQYRQSMGACIADSLSATLCPESQLRVPCS